MGGKALKEYGVARISNSEYDKRLVQIHTYMANLPDGVECRHFVPGGVIKDDHGDVDVLYTSANPAAVVAHFKRLMGSSGSKKNGNVNSIEWSGFQVDFIHVSADKFDFACHYYAHGTYAALLGKLARYYGFKLGWQGLSFYMRSKFRQHEELITRDWDEALTLLGYETKLDPKSTLSQQELYDHLVSSPLISRRIYKTSRPDRNYGFQEDFFNWIDIQAQVPENVKSRSFGWILVARRDLPTALRLLTHYGNMHIQDWIQPVKRWYKKVKYVWVYPLAYRVRGWV